MVFPGMLKPSSPKPASHPIIPPPMKAPSTNTSTTSLGSTASQEVLASTSQEASPGGSATSEDPDLRELNNSLNALAAIFPDVQVEVFREMLSSFEEESRLAVVTETLLKNKMQWVRGRYRVVSKEPTILNEEDNEKGEQGEHPKVIPVEETFRTSAYRNAVKTITYHEFKGLSRSTLNAVLAEFNHCYTLARPMLIGLSSKSWRFSISSLFLRRKTMSSPEAEHHPLIIWQSTGQGPLIPTLKGTGCQELDKELYDSFLVPIQQRMALEMEEKDRALALQLNNQEAERHEALHDCECCFSSITWEEMAACNGGGHAVCFRCVRHAVNEAIFGQGWQRNIDFNSGTLRCVAAMVDDCDGCIPRKLVDRAYLNEKGGQDILNRFDERLSEENLLRTKLPLIRCPFCNYAEVDELYLPESQRTWRIKRPGPTSFYTLTLLILGMGMIPFCMPFFLLFTALFLFLSTTQSFPNYILDHFHASLLRIHRKRLGLKFTCLNPTCRRSSCISCSKPWTDIHICHESSLLALRTQVELAMSLAIKRTCPRCNTSFVKSAGCNKLTCICGYQMCYVCRKDIGSGEGYRHFCEHFRPAGRGTCSDCDKCDLYRCESDEVVVKKAKEEAEKRWLDKEGGELGAGGEEKVRKALEGGWKAGRGVPGEGRRACYWWKGVTWEQLLDVIVEGVVE